MKELFAPVALTKGFTAKNRLVRSATWEGLADEEGNITPAITALYEELARGGIGTIVSGIMYAEKSDQCSRNMPGLDEDRFIAGNRELCEKIHAYDCRIVAQIGACGAASHFETDRRRVYAPSSHPGDDMYPGALEMTKDEICAFFVKYAAACRRAKEAGYDAVQLHGAHGFLVTQFLSPRYNHRQDEYGGSLENRARFVFEMLAAARGAVGDDYPLWIKFNCEDFQEGGMTFEECRFVCRGLAEHGIDLIEISGGNCNGSLPSEGPMRTGIRTVEEEGYFLPQARQIAEDVPVPVMTVGGYRSREKMEAVLAETKIEMIALCRPLICEPDLPDRLRTGALKRAHCYSCMDLRCKKIYGGECLYARMKRLGKAE